MNSPGAPTIRGRGAAENPPNRFEPLRLEPDADGQAGETPSPKTQFFRDATQSIIAYNDSPDVGFNASVNPYRGCEHGCIYCFARPSHEYLGFSGGLDFETKIMVKENAAALLRQELSAPKWRPQVIALSPNTDCYQPVERKLKLTRACLEVLAEFRNPVGMITKNYLITRDLDLLAQLATVNACSVCVSVTTLDNDLSQIMEPRASLPQYRLAAIRELAQAGIPVTALVAPVIPGLNDHAIPAILKAVAQAGATAAGYVLLRLPHGQKDLFVAWLNRHFPDRAEKVLQRLRAMRGGKLYDSRWEERMAGRGIFAEQIERLFETCKRREGLDRERPEPSTAAFRRPSGAQLQLWS